MAEEIINSGTENENGSGTDNEVKTYTLEEVQEMLQKEGDRRVTQALAKQKKEYEKKINLAGLDEAAREKAQNQMRIQELEEQLAQFNLEKNRSELKSVLSTRGLSAEFADILAISEDLEESQQNIDKLDTLFKAAVKAEVEKRLSGSPPKGGSNNNGSGAMTKESFLKLPLHKQMELYNSNQTYYGQFLK